jgi:hypothetical protein
MNIVPDFNQSTAPEDKWLTPGRFALASFLLVLILFYDVILGSHTFFFRDFSIFAYQWAQFHRDSFWRGEIPLWNPLSNCGLPFLAQWNTMTLYPLSLIYLLFPLSWSLAVFCIAHLWLGGMGMFFLARRWTGSPVAAGVAGVAFAFGGLTVNSLAWTNNIAALAWMPWVIDWSERSWRDGGRSVFLAALIGATQLLAGAPEIITLTWVLAGANWLVFQIRSCPSSGLARNTGRFCLLIILVAGLTAAQMLPFFELLSQSQRSQSYGGNSWAMPGWGWANFLVPRFYTFLWGHGVSFQYDQYWTSSYYTGIGVVLLAILALWRVREKRVWFLGTVVCLSLILSLGDAGYLLPGLKKIFPQLGFFRFPIKFITLAVFLFPLLAAYAVARLQAVSPGGLTTWRRYLWLNGSVLLILVAAITWFGWQHPLYGGSYTNRAETLYSASSRAFFLVVIIGILTALMSARRPRTRGLLSCALLLGIWLDLVTHMPNQNPRVERWVYKSFAELSSRLPPVKLGESRAMPSPPAELELHESILLEAEQHCLRNRISLYCNWNVMDHLPKVGGIYSLHLHDVEDIESLFYKLYPQPCEPLLDFLAVAYTNSPGHTTTWKSRSTALPWITAGQRPVFVTAEEALKKIGSPDFTPRETVYLSPELKSSVTATNSTSARVVVRHFGFQHLEADVEAAAPAMVVIAQAWYPSWRAFVDGTSVPLWRANTAFQALEVPAGRHKIKLVYSDRRFFTGGVISGITFLICMAGLFRKSAIPKSNHQIPVDPACKAR